MLAKLVIVLFLILILCCLGSALYYLLTGKGGSTSMAKALSWRIGLSLLLFVLLFVGFATGVLHPHPFSPFVQAPPANASQ